ncbi:MAG TPA: LacI family DNA-binding transcriptional regulator [Lachnospiraceae bacterium]|nr:LacI family DNA-binding transcriptional regulator [Lachnospiraceae bacterium]
MVTLKEVAQRCGVSVATVSNTLNGKPKVSEATKQRVLEVVKQTGYQPNYFAQGMRKQKTEMIGIITEDLNEFSSTPIVEAIMAYCEDHGYRTILINMRMYDKWKNTWYNDDKKLQSVLQSAITEMLSIKVDGIVYVAGHCRVVNCFPEDFNIPAIIVYALSKSPKFTSVIIDDEKGGYDMTKYLISMGHRKIGVIGGVADNIHTQSRLIGCQKALYENQIPFNPAWLCFGDWRRQSAKENMEKLIEAGVTAVFCMNDLMAGGAYDCIIDQKLQVGRDISVVGYDNRMISEYLRPRLTTNEIPFQEIGKKAVEIMLEKLEKGPEDATMPKIIMVPCTMEIRDSVTQR